MNRDQRHAREAAKLVWLGYSVSQVAAILRRRVRTVERLLASQCDAPRPSPAPAAEDVTRRVPKGDTP